MHGGSSLRQKAQTSGSVSSSSCAVASERIGFLYKIIDHVNDVGGRLLGQRVIVWDLHERSQLNIYKDPMISTVSRASNKGLAIPLANIQVKN